jgi:hypothetical protein
MVNCDFFGISYRFFLQMRLRLKKFIPICFCQVPIARMEDSGDYYCIVKDGVNEVHSKIATVQVTKGNDRSRKIHVTNAAVHLFYA